MGAMRHRPARALPAVLVWALPAVLVWALAAPAGLTPAATAAPLPPSAPLPSAAPVPGPADGTGWLGLALSGVGSGFTPPTRPTVVPYSPRCARLVDAGFRGRCTVARGPGGLVAGVVEVARAPLATHERDLVWRATAGHWVLALRHEVTDPAAPARLWSVRVATGQGPYLAFMTPGRHPGFARQMVLVGEDGQVSLYRYLGDGFVVAPGQGDLVCYRPGAAEGTAGGGYFDQLLVGRYQGHWRFVAQQDVPRRAALSLYRGELSGPGARPAP